MNMKAKILFFASIFSLVTLLAPLKIHAQQQASGSSASFNDVLSIRVQDQRAKILKAYLVAHNSPLADYSDVFVAQADLYDLDWRFLVAISGVESTFGQQVPGCPNAWGWNIYGGHIYCFNSYDEAIRTISKEMKERYIDNWHATTVDQVGAYYAASPTWSSRVTYFMHDIDRFAATVPTNDPLPISL